MKKTVITLSIIAIIVTACGQTPTQQSANLVAETLDFAEPQNMIESELFYIREIDSATFFALKEKINPQHVELEAITDLEEAKKLLEGIITWGTWDNVAFGLIEDSDGELIYKITFRNGNTISHRNIAIQPHFRAFYPGMDILFLEGNCASSTVTFDLTTGENRKTVGDPDYFVFSPSKKNRLNGWYNGAMDCTILFIQTKKDGRFQTIIDLHEDFLNAMDFSLCFIPNAFWTDDTTLNINVPKFFERGREDRYFQIILK